MFLIAVLGVILGGLYFVSDSKKLSLKYGRFFTRADWWTNFLEGILAFSILITFMLLVCFPTVIGALNWLSDSSVPKVEPKSLIENIDIVFESIIRIFNPANITSLRLL